MSSFFLTFVKKLYIFLSNILSSNLDWPMVATTKVRRILVLLLNPRRKRAVIPHAGMRNHMNKFKSTVHTGGERDSTSTNYWSLPTETGLTHNKHSLSERQKNTFTRISWFLFCWHLPLLLFSLFSHISSMLSLCLTLGVTPSLSLRFSLQLVL